MFAIIGGRGETARWRMIPSSQSRRKDKRERESVCVCGRLSYPFRIVVSDGICFSTPCFNQRTGAVSCPTPNRSLANMAPTHLPGQK